MKNILLRSADKAFKKLFEDTFILCEFIKMFLPVLIDEYGVNQDSIEIQNTEFLSADLKTKLADVLAYVKTDKTEKFRVPPNNWTIKITVFIHPAQEALTILPP